LKNEGKKNEKKKICSFSAFLHPKNRKKSAKMLLGNAVQLSCESQEEEEKNKK